ncbi:hypothetical protein [Sphingomonas abietis]|uniref:Uncharacterized protein n=1 Tax=Sphingomonas abietis TaxID=3012344 RepID=A0ABY7NH78_9SPHN|nr:hypothetical protein [Sphingomonas abietis]WBO20892.1 hypothetical protein PBT88_11785 [Sphingomonas abietis]
MTTTAHWLHLRLGLPLVEIEAEAGPAPEAHCEDADIIALQKAFAAAPLAVEFMAR